MFYLALLISSCVVKTTLATENNEKFRFVYSAQCEARCLSKSQAPSNGTFSRACLKPCVDVENFHKVKSCTQFCEDFVKSSEVKDCKTSCKLLLRLYNTGGEKRQSIEHSLPNRPTDANASVLSVRKTSQVLITWSYNNTRQDTQQPTFIIETRYYKEKPFFMSEWTYCNKTRATSIKVTPQPDTWSEYRIMSVNEYGTSDYSNPTSPVYTMPARPTPPRDFRVLGQIRRKDKVSITLAWSKPLNLEIPVHRYRIFWSPRLDAHTKQLQSIRVHHVKLKGDIHALTLHGLLMNTTYQLELQAICHYKGKRLRSKRVILLTTTLDEEQEKRAVPFMNHFKKKKIKNKMQKYPKIKQSNKRIEKIKPTDKTNTKNSSPKSYSPNNGTVSMEGQKSAQTKNTCIRWLVITVVTMITLLVH